MLDPQEFELDSVTRRYVFKRKSFLVLALHWALLVIAVPIISLIDNTTICSVYCIFGFLSTLFLSFIWPAPYLLSLTKPSRYLNNIRGRTVCTELKRFSIVIRIIMIPLFLIFISGFIIFFNGGPSIDNGIYCIMNHSTFIREITQEEYIRLSRIERLFFTSGLALMRSGIMLNCCYADQII